MVSNDRVAQCLSVCLFGSRQWPYFVCPVTYSGIDKRASMQYCSSFLTGLGHSPEIAFLHGALFKFVPTNYQAFHARSNPGSQISFELNCAPIFAKPTYKFVAKLLVMPQRTYSEGSPFVSPSRIHPLPSLQLTLSLHHPFPTP